MAGFFDKAFATLGGAGEGFLKGAGIAALIGAVVCGGGAALALGWVASGLVALVSGSTIAAGIVGTLGTVVTVVGSVMAAYVGAVGLAPYGGVIKAPFTAVKRLKESNRADLENSQVALMQGNAELSQAENRVADSIARAQNVGGYAEVPIRGAGQQGIPVENPNARTDNAARIEKQRLEQFANLGMTAGR